MSTADKAMQLAERTLTSDQEQDLEDQRKEQASPPVKEFILPEARKYPMKLNLTTFSMPAQGKKRFAK